MLLLHPDRNEGIDMGTQEVNGQLRKIVDIFKMFVTKNIDGISGRSTFGMDSDKAMRAQKEEVQHDDAGALEEVQWKIKAMKRQEPVNENKINTNLDNCVLLFQNGQSQIN